MLNLNTKKSNDNVTRARTGRKESLWRKIIKQKALILMTIPGLLVVLIFNYFPMYGVLIAFKDYSPRAGIMGSPGRLQVF